MKDLLLSIFFLKARAENLSDAFNLLASTAEKSGYNKNTNLELMIGRGILMILTLLGTIFLILIIYAGFNFLTAGGNETKVGKATSIIKNSVIGLLIVVSAYTLSYYLISRLLIHVNF
jgi:sterol desaturase/sphingolipid hydroxylase (fatty acid hydroxylase superfamily)